MTPIDQGLVGMTLVGADGEKIGRIDGIYVNNASGEPEWVAINLGGLMATKHGFAPVAEVKAEGGKAVVRFDKKHVKQGPTTKNEGFLTPDENNALYSYYGMTHDQEVHAGSHAASLS